MANILGDIPVTFALWGNIVLLVLFSLSVLLGLSGIVNLLNPTPSLQKISTSLFVSITILFFAGFLLICWLHFMIYSKISLVLPADMAGVINKQLNLMNARSSFPIPLYDHSSPPRYLIPVWIESEKYYFWFMCYSFMALVAHFKLTHPRFMASLYLLLAIQISLLFFLTNPFSAALPQFFSEISPWFKQGLNLYDRLGIFMKLYPKLIFYYNASYMWFHPPLLFIAYASITITFCCSIFMLIRREAAIEKLCYEFAKIGFYMLTLGMLLGYPWALKAWGPNWWWDPKICSSIMMWAIYSTYLHTRLYASRPSMWYFSSILGILCFAAMIFTFITSFYFPGEHTFQ